MRSAELHVLGRVAIDPSGGRLQPKRFLDGVRDDRPIARTIASSAPGVVRTCQNSDVVMPSLVSMPPNIITAAFDTISWRLSVSVASARTPPARSMVAPTCRSRAATASWGSIPDLATGRHPVHGGDDLVIPAEHDSGLDVEELKRGGDDADGERAGEVAADLRTGSGAECLDKVRGLGSDPLPEPLHHLWPTEGRRERVTMTTVLLTIEREHARADHASRREARIVDGEASRIAHDIDA